MPVLLDRRIQFQRATLVSDGLSRNEIFSDYGDPVWASKTDVSDGERWRAGEVAAQITTRFVVPRDTFTSSLTAADEMICENVTYQITGVKEFKGQRHWLEITAAAKV